MNHTPGPWSIVGNEHAHTIISESFVIADVFCPDPECDSPATEEEAEANARLIAAAPELLRNLKAMVRWADPLECGEVHEEAQALIISLQSNAPH